MCFRYFGHIIDNNETPLGAAMYMITLSNDYNITFFRLTAFVAKSFHQAKPFIFIDDEVITRAIDWMISKQNADGSFPEPGRIIHKNMQASQNCVRGNI